MPGADLGPHRVRRRRPCIEKAASSPPSGVATAAHPDGIWRPSARGTICRPPIGSARIRAAASSRRRRSGRARDVGAGEPPRRQVREADPPPSGPARESNGIGVEQSRRFVAPRDGVAFDRRRGLPRFGRAWRTTRAASNSSSARYGRDPKRRLPGGLSCREISARRTSAAAGREAPAGVGDGRERPSAFEAMSGKAAVERGAAETERRGGARDIAAVVARARARWPRARSHRGWRRRVPCGCARRPSGPKRPSVGCATASAGNRGRRVSGPPPPPIHRTISGHEDDACRRIGGLDHFERRLPSRPDRSPVVKFMSRKHAVIGSAPEHGGEGCRRVALSNPADMRLQRQARRLITSALSSTRG